MDEQNSDDFYDLFLRHFCVNENRVYIITAATWEVVCKLPFDPPREIVGCLSASTENLCLSVSNLWRWRMWNDELEENHVLASFQYIQSILDYLLFDDDRISEEQVIKMYIDELEKIYKDPNWNVKEEDKLDLRNYIDKIEGEKDIGGSQDENV